VRGLPTRTGGSLAFEGDAEAWKEEALFALRQSPARYLFIPIRLRNPAQSPWFLRDIGDLAYVLAGGCRAQADTCIHSFRPADKPSHSR
jgi:hypothetical protein